MDHVKQYRPPACAHCCADLATGELTASVINHWVHELQEIRPVFTDHQCLDVRCAMRGRMTRGLMTRGRMTRGRMTRGRMTRGRMTRGRMTRGRMTRGRMTRGLMTCGLLPAGVPTGHYGPTVQAMTGLLPGEHEQRVRQTSTVMTEALHVPMSTGMVAKTQDQVSRALAPSFQEALAHVQRDDRAHADAPAARPGSRPMSGLSSRRCARNSGS